MAKVTYFYSLRDNQTGEEWACMEYNPAYPDNCYAWNINLIAAGWPKRVDGEKGMHAVQTGWKIEG